jgi:hypothetical protein
VSEPDNHPRHYCVDTLTGRYRGPLSRKAAYALVMTMNVMEPIPEGSHTFALGRYYDPRGQTRFISCRERWCKVHINGFKAQEVK